MAIAAGLRRVEFVLALLLYQTNSDPAWAQKYHSALIMACRSMPVVSARRPQNQCFYMGLEQDILNRIETPSDPHCQILVVEALLQHGVSVDAEDPTQPGLTPLFWAINHNRSFLALLLAVKYEANPLVRDPSEGGNLLSLAAYRNNYHTCKLLLGLPEAIRRELLETPNRLGETALHLAAWKGNAAIIKLLLQHGAPTTPSQFFGRNVLHLSAECANKRGFELLFEHIQGCSSETLKEMLNAQDMIGSIIHASTLSDPYSILIRTRRYAAPHLLWLKSYGGSTNRPVSSQDRNMCRIFYKLRRCCAPVSPTGRLNVYSATQSSTQNSRSFSGLNHSDAHDLTPLHHLLFFNGGFPETLKVMLRYGTDPWKQSRIGAMPLQIPAHKHKSEMV